MFKKDRIEIVDFKKEARRRERKEAIKSKWNEFAWWFRQNQDILIIAIPAGVAVVGGATKVASKAIKTHNLNKEIKFKETTIYDHSLGRYVQLKHKLTPAQALTIEERRANGEKLHMILEDMKLLKH